MVLREGRYATSARLPALPPGKEPIDVVTEYLSCLWQYAKERITEEIGSVADLGTFAAYWNNTLWQGCCGKAEPQRLTRNRFLQRLPMSF